jgi:hypothetical protein
VRIEVLARLTYRRGPPICRPLRHGPNLSGATTVRRRSAEHDGVRRPTTQGRSGPAPARCPPSSAGSSWAPTTTRSTPSTTAPTPGSTAPANRPGQGSCGGTSRDRRSTHGPRTAAPHRPALRSPGRSPPVRGTDSVPWRSPGRPRPRPRRTPVRASSGGSSPSPKPIPCRTVAPM